MSATPPCTGQWELFDSTVAEDHYAAKALCAACPMLTACREQLEAAHADAYNRANGPRGTWAGELVGAPPGGSHNPLTLNAEERMYDDTAAKAAHAAYIRGDCSEWARVGERVYRRRVKRQSRAKRREMAA